MGAYLARGSGLTSIMSQRITRILAAFCPLAFASDSNNGPSPGHSNLGVLKKITIAALLISLFSPPKCHGASFKRAQSVNKNFYDTTSLLYTSEVSPLQSKKSLKRECYSNFLDSIFQTVCLFVWVRFFFLNFVQ